MNDTPTTSSEASTRALLTDLRHVARSPMVLMAGFGPMLETMATHFEDLQKRLQWIEARLSRVERHMQGLRR